jgi:GAG-pre-integrase domain
MILSIECIMHCSKVAHKNNYVRYVYMLNRKYIMDNCKSANTHKSYKVRIRVKRARNGISKRSVIRNVSKLLMHAIQFVSTNLSKRYCKYRLSTTIKRNLSLMVNVSPDPGEPNDQFDMDDVAFALSNTIRFDTDSIPVKVDNCCTRTMSGFESDFIPGTMKVLVGVNVYGFADSKSQITHTGTIGWKISDDEGMDHDICVPNSYYVPGCRARLLSPQHWAQEVNDNFPSIDGTWCATFHDRVVISWQQRRFKKTILLDKSRNNVAMMWTAGGINKFVAFRNMLSNVSVCYDATIAENETMIDKQYDDRHVWDTLYNVNHEGDDVLGIEGVSKASIHTENSQELLEWHIRLGHMPMSRLQKLAAEGVMPSRLAKCKIPICAGCMYGKMARKPWKTKNSNPVITDDSNLRPGDCVSVDQLVSSVPGFIAQLKGIPTRNRYKVATVFVDHASDYTYVHLQVDTSSVQTLLAKTEFERYAKSVGVTIHRYHADNGRFVDHAWTDHVRESRQSMTLCGVNAHHQNGRVEKRIRDLQDLGRASILQAKQLWPDAVETSLWPYAIRKCAYDLNHIKKQVADKSPLEIFASTNIKFNIKNFHTFGCPMYVLTNTKMRDEDNQDSLAINNKIDKTKTGPKTSKWESKARLAVYLGPSPNHATSVGLALSLQTGLVSPVFHAKYDDTFQTVMNAYGKYVTKSLWQVKCGLQKGIVQETWVEPKNTEMEPSNELPLDPETRLDQEGDRHLGIPEIDEEEAIDVVDGNEPATQERNPVPNQNIETVNGGQHYTTRSGRQVRPPSYLADYVAYAVDTESSTSHNLTDDVDPIALMLTGNQDNFYYHEILREPDCQEFLKAMQAEIDDHNNNKNWVPVLRSTLPKGTKVIPSVWAMRRKRRLTDGSIYKWKARLNVDGSKQIRGVNFWETYAPVAQ